MGALEGVFSSGKRMANGTSSPWPGIRPSTQEPMKRAKHLEGEFSIQRRAGWEIVHVPYCRWWCNGWLSDRHDPKFQTAANQLFAELRLALGLA
jgi:hypothetical protein